MKVLLLAAMILAVWSAAAKTTAYGLMNALDRTKCDLTFNIQLSASSPSNGDEAVFSFFSTSAAAIAAADTGITCFLTVVGGVLDAATSGCDTVTATSVDAATADGNTGDFSVSLATGATGPIGKPTITFYTAKFTTAASQQTVVSGNKVYVGADEAVAAVATDYLLNANTAASSGQIIYLTTCREAITVAVVSDAKNWFALGLVGVLGIASFF